MYNIAVNPDSFVRGAKVVCFFFCSENGLFEFPWRSRESLNAFRSRHFHTRLSLQGALLVGRTPRRFQVLAPRRLLSVLRGAAAQREDAH